MLNKFLLRITKNITKLALKRNYIFRFTCKNKPTLE